VKYISVFPLPFDAMLLPPYPGAASPATPTVLFESNGPAGTEPEAGVTIKVFNVCALEVTSTEGRLRAASKAKAMMGDKSFL
jgi:hypothetical protein